MKTKKCMGPCGEFKEITEFKVHWSSKDGYENKCKKCKQKLKEKLPEGYKRCKECNKKKLLSDFPKNYKMPDGYLNQCKECKKLICKKWRKNNPNKIKKYSKYYYQNNKEKLFIKSKKWEEENKEYRKKLNKEWKNNNKEQVRKYRNIYQKQRRKSDINFRIIGNMRNSIRKMIKGNPKLETTMKLVGCTIEFLIKHIEKQFKLKMNWNNYGSYWEIDHIIPCSLFDFTKETEQRKCFHYSNLQPLTCKDNRKKNNKLDWVKE